MNGIGVALQGCTLLLRAREDDTGDCELKTIMCFMQNRSDCKVAVAYKQVRGQQDGLVQEPQAHAPELDRLAFQTLVTVQAT